MVLQVLPQLKADGGVEASTLECSEALVQSGNVALVAAADGALRPRLEKLGARVFVMPLKSRNPINIGLNFWRLLKLIRAERPHIIHARSRGPAWSAFWAARRTATPFVTTFHGFYGYRFCGLSLPPKKLYNSVMAKGDAVVVASKFMHRHLRTVYGVAESRLTLIPRGVNLAKFRPPTQTTRSKMRRRLKIADCEKLILMPSRLSVWKGQFLALEAAAGIGTLLFLGGGSKRIKNRLKAEAERLGAKVRFAAATTAVEDFIAAADVVLSASSKPEAFGRTPLEAQSTATVPIAPAHGGALEVIADCENGFLFTPGDVASCRAALKKALTPMAAKTAAAVRRSMLSNAAKFGHEKVGAGYLRLYAKIAAR